MKKRTIITTEIREIWIFHDETIERSTGHDSSASENASLPVNSEPETETQPDEENEK